MKRMFLLLPGFVVACCGGSESSDNCADVVCDQPPADECKDAGTLVEYESTGTCDPETGRCEYGFAERHCDHGCAGGRCLQEDKCRGVVCDQPPENTCKDGSTLLVYEAVGDCSPDTGECVYDGEERGCDNGCANGACQDQDLCQGVICDDPPASACKDENTLLEYDAEGTCNPDTGRCEYGSFEKHCENGCSEGSCRSDSVGGWISVLEVNQSWLDAPWGWDGGLRAYFTTAPRFTRSLPWHTHLYLNEIAGDGNCILYALDLRFLPPPCEPPCDPDQDCIEEGGQWICVDQPEQHFNVGDIIVGGLKTEATLIADEWDRYLAEGLPADLFDDGDVVTVNTSGGDLEPFSLQANGVAHLEIASDTLALARDQAAVVSWTPADPDSRVLVSLLMGHHWPTVPWVGLLCDAPDGDGRVEISATLVNGFIDRAFETMYGHPCHVIRYSREAISPFGQEIELFIGSMRNLQLTMP